MFVLGHMGQMPSVSTYTLLTLGFPLHDATKQKYIVSTPKRSANQIVEAYPWLAGQVVIEKPPIKDQSTSSGTTKVVEYEPHAGKSKFVHGKDCTSLCPSFGDIFNARGPLSMLDGTIISPVYGFANFYPEDVVKPVTIVQANFINGGVLLTIATHHNVMDANGNEQFIRQFASLCCGDKLSEEDIRIGNSDQNTIVPPLKPVQEIDPLERFRCPSDLGAKTPWPPVQGNLWKCLRFRKSSVLALKSEASRFCSSQSDVPYISSNDAVTAFIWTRLTTARSAWLPRDSSTTLIRAVNGRRRLEKPIPAAYMGHSILCCNTTIPLQSAIYYGISSAAIKLRKTLLEVDDHQVRSFFRLLQTEKDRTTIVYGAQMNPVMDIMITSFTAQKS